MRSRDRGPHRFKLNSGPAADAAWPCRCRQSGKLDGGGICPTSKQIPNGRQSFWKQAWVDNGTRGRKIENRVVFELVQRAGRLQQLGGPGSSTPVRGKPQLLPGHRCCPPPPRLATHFNGMLFSIGINSWVQGSEPSQCPKEPVIPSGHKARQVLGSR
jgi:hypothetical protein